MNNENDIKSFTLRIKNNSKVIDKATDAEAREVLNSVSEPLLRSYLSSLSTNKTLSIDDDVIPLVGYILKYAIAEQTRQLALLVIMSWKRMLKGNDLENGIIDQIENLVAIAETSIQRYEIISLISTLYPIMPDTCTKLFLTDDSTVKMLANEITILLTSDISQLISNKGSNAYKILTLFSSACVDNSCRKVIANLYLGFLIKIIKMDSENSVKLELQCLSASVIIKIWKSISKKDFKTENDLLNLEHLSEILVNGMIRRESASMISNSIEGLAFLSLNINVKQSMRNDDNFITALLDRRNLEQSYLVAYGTLCIITNLTSFNRVLTEKQKSIEKLRQYNDLSNIDPKTGRISNGIKKDDNYAIEKFSQYLLSSKGVVSQMVNTFKKFGSKGIHKQTIQIIYNLCIKPSLRTDVIKQGGLNIILTYLTSQSECVKYNAKSFCSLKKEVDDPETRLFAMKSLSKIVMSRDPSALFYQKFDIISPAPFLLEEAVQYAVNVEGIQYLTPLHRLPSEMISAADCFEALVGLTNLSSVDNIKIKEIITSLGWPAISALMLSSDRQIQRADLELLSNIMVSPICSQKFFDWKSEDDQNHKNFVNLCRLMHLDDRSARLAILNIFANTSDYEILAQVMLSSPEFCNQLMDLITNEVTDDEAELRCLYILLNLLHTDSSKLKSKLTSNVHNVVKKFAEKSEGSQVKQIAKEILNG